MSNKKRRPKLPVGIRLTPLAFRAWHIPTAKMWKVGMFSDHHVFRAWDDSLSDEENYKVVDVHMLREDCVLMQLTEFTDRTGQPLFEGDILRLDMVLCKADQEAALEAEPDIDPEYSCYEYISCYRGAFKLVSVGDTIDPTDGSINWYGWLHEEQNFVNEATLSLDRTLAGNIYEHPEIAAQTSCFPLHPDHIRDYDEHPCNQ